MQVGVEVVGVGVVGVEVGVGVSVLGLLASAEVTFDPPAVGIGVDPPAVFEAGFEVSLVVFSVCGLPVAGAMHFASGELPLVGGSVLPDIQA